MPKYVYTKEYISKNLISNNRIIDLTQLNDVNITRDTKVNCVCLTCGIESLVILRSFIKQGCRHCAKYKWDKQRVEIEFELLKDNRNIVWDKTSLPKGVKSKLCLFCPNCKREAFQTISAIFSSKCGCPYCSGNVKWSEERVKSEFFDSTKKIIWEKTNKIETSKSKLCIYCIICGKEFFQRIDSVMNRKDGCLNCKNYSKERVEREFNLLPDKKYYQLIESDTTKNNGKIIIRCLTCNKNWYATPGCFYNKGTRCPNCKSSKGEYKITEFLEQNDIDFKRQYTFSNCRKKRLLRFDFFVPAKNLIIEYHGQQHYVTVKRWDKDDGFARRQEYDAFKMKCALESGYNYLVIPYWEFDNVEQVLKVALSI